VSKAVRVVTNEASNGAAEGFARSKALSLLNSGAKNLTQNLTYYDAKIRISIRGGQAFIYISEQDRELWADFTVPISVDGTYRFYIGSKLSNIKEYSTPALEEALRTGKRNSRFNSIYGVVTFRDTSYVIAIRDRISTSQPGGLDIGCVYGEGKKQTFFPMYWPGADDNDGVGPRICKYEAETTAGAEEINKGVIFFGKNQLPFNRVEIVSRTILEKDMPFGEELKILFDWRVGFSNPFFITVGGYMIQRKVTPDSIIGFIISHQSNTVPQSFPDPLKVFICRAGGGLQGIVSLEPILPETQLTRRYLVSVSTNINDDVAVIIARDRIAQNVSKVVTVNMKTQAIANVATINSQGFVSTAVLGPGIFLVYTDLKTVTLHSETIPIVFSDEGRQSIMIAPLTSRAQYRLEMIVTRQINPDVPESSAEIYLSVNSPFNARETVWYKGAYSIGDPAINFSEIKGPSVITERPSDISRFTTYLGKK
jgi:hypothetical protein